MMSTSNILLHELELAALLCAMLTRSKRIAISIS